VTGPR